MTNQSCDYAFEMLRRLRCLDTTAVLAWRYGQSQTVQAPSSAVLQLSELTGRPNLPPRPAIWQAAACVLVVSSVDYLRIECMNRTIDRVFCGLLALGVLGHLYGTLTLYKVGTEVFTWSLAGVLAAALIV